MKSTIQEYEQYPGIGQLFEKTSNEMGVDASKCSSVDQYIGKVFEKTSTKTLLKHVNSPDMIELHELIERELKKRGE